MCGAATLPWAHELPLLPSLKPTLPKEPFCPAPAPEMVHVPVCAQVLGNTHTHWPGMLSFLCTPWFCCLCTDMDSLPVLQPRNQW